MNPIQVGLYDAETNELITLLQDGQKIPANLVKGRELAIAATVSDDGPLSGKVGSMILNLNDGQVRRTENTSPYSLFGDKDGNFFSGRGFQAGKQKIAFSLFSKLRGGGNRLGNVVIDFEIVEGSSNSAPQITSKNSVTVAENNTFALNVNARDDSDAENKGLTYQLTGGADGDLFSLDRKSGKLAFKSAPDYENPLDAGANNTYNVEVTASDSQGLTDVQNIAIKVGDRPEAQSLPESVEVGLYDAKTDKLITLLKDGAKIPASLVEGRNFTIVASVPSDSPLSGKVGSIYLNYNDGTFTKTENAAPYALFGDGKNNNFFSRQTIAAGDHSIALSMFSKRERSGNVLEKLELNFEIVEDDSTPGGPKIESEEQPNGAPTIFSANKASILEGKTQAIDVNASDDGDREGAGLTYRLTGNADDKLFRIDSKTGKLAFKSAPDFDKPQDIGKNNKYNVEVTVSDSEGLTDVQDLEISVNQKPTPDPKPEPRPKTDFFLTDGFDHFIAHNDGNNNDVDDIASIPIQAAYISAAGLQDRTTFFYNNNLGEPNNTRNGKTPRNYDQPSTVAESAAFAEKLGIQTYDYQAGMERTTQKLVDILNSGKKILIFEGGPMEATYRALQRVSKQNRSNITLMTHGSNTFNQNRDLTTRRGVFEARTWSDIFKDFPEVKRIQIENQNGPDKSAPLGFNSTLWNWLDDTKDPLLQEARELMKNTRSKLSTNDPSDSGMIFYALTGKENGDPNDARDFFKKYSPSLNVKPTLVIQGPPSVTDKQTRILDVETVTSNGDAEGRGLTYKISGGTDRSKFKIDNKGILSFRNAPSFSNPNDTNKDNLYDVEVTVTDSDNRSDRERFEVEVRPSNAPKIISSSTVKVNSGQKLALDIDAVDNIDEERSGLLYKITGGADRSKFEIDADSSGSLGRLTFKTPPKAGSPTDANRDNTYQVEVSVTDSDGLTDKQSIKVLVTGGGNQSAPSSSRAVASQSVTDSETLSPIQVGLYDAKTDKLIAPIEDGARISANLLDTKNLTISAVVPNSSPLSGQVESIFLNLNNGAITRIESNEPYALFGDNGGNFTVGQGISKGSNKISLGLYSEDERKGELLGTVTHDFTIA